MLRRKPKYLQVSVKVLTILSIWPQDGYFALFKQYYITGLLGLTLIPVFADLVTQFYEDVLDFGSIIEDVIAFTALSGVVYIALCFITSKNEIEGLVNDLESFEKFSNLEVMQATERSAGYYAKLFMAYGLFGNFCYALMPWLNYTACSKTVSAHMIKYGILCGMITSYVLPFRYDTAPLMQILIVSVIIECLLATTVVMSVTMLMCGVLIHVTSHLRQLRLMLLNAQRTQGGEIRICAEFHQEIISYALRCDVCFNKMMLLHVTWTGFVISVLGFEIVMTENLYQSFQYAMHLLGWLMTLFIVCYYGQTLMDEVSETAFFWGESAKFQKCTLLILMRSQKALTVSAAGLKVMSLSTFINILYSAYSYFTLLLKLKP